MQFPRICTAGTTRRQSQVAEIGFADLLAHFRIIHPLLTEPPLAHETGSDSAMIVLRAVFIG